MANIIARLRELHKPVYIVTERLGGDGEDEHCTLSESPDEPGWCTDSGYPGYGLPEATAERYAESINAIPALLEYVERLERGITPPGYVMVPVEVVASALVGAATLASQCDNRGDGAAAKGWREVQDACVAALKEAEGSKVKGVRHETD